MDGIGIPWWIAGGNALDLHVGRTLREHEDTDVSILRRDHLKVQRHLFNRWQLFKTNQPGLAPWPMAEPLPIKVGNIWLRRDDTSPWAFQLMLDEAEGEQWIYRRKPTIKRPLKEIIAHTFDGIPYLRPEVQLLYKVGSSVRRDKDFWDLKALLPFLKTEEMAWLRDALKQQFSDGDEWLNYIDTH